MPAPFRGIAPGGCAGRLPPWLGRSLEEQTAPSQANKVTLPTARCGRRVHSHELKILTSYL